MQDIKLLTGPKVDINQIRFRDDNRVRPMNDAWVNVDLEGSLKQLRKMHLNAEFGAIGRRDDIRAFADHRVKMLAPKYNPLRVGFPQVVNKPLPAWLDNDLMMNHHPIEPNWFWPAGRARSGRIFHDVKIVKQREHVGGNPFLKLKLPEDFKVGPDNMPRLKEPPVDLKGVPVKVDPVDALKGIWKAPRAFKEGLPANHPAMKGVHIGRRGDEAVNADFHRAIMRPVDMNFDREGWINQPIGGVGLGVVGAFHDVWQAWRGRELDVFAGGIGVGKPARHLHIHQEIAHPVKAKPQEDPYVRKYEFERLDCQKEDSVQSYIRVCLKLMTEPGADWCQLIANMYDRVKTTGVCKVYARKGLERLGFRLLGRGHFSTAFQGPDKLVYKVNANRDGTDGWFVYAVNIKCGNVTGCVPNIGDVAYKRTTYCVAMERLEPLGMFSFGPYEGLAGAIRNREVDTVAVIMNITRSNAEKFIDLVLTSKNQSGGNCRFDIHSDNVMLRRDSEGNAQIVLTDPLAYGDFRMADVYNRLTEHQQDASNLCQAA